MKKSKSLLFLILSVVICTESWAQFMQRSNLIGPFGRRQIERNNRMKAGNLFNSTLIIKEVESGVMVSEEKGRESGSKTKKEYSSYIRNCGEVSLDPKLGDTSLSNGDKIAVYLDRLRRCVVLSWKKQ